MSANFTLMGLRNRTQLTNYHCFFVTTTCNQFLPLLEPVAVKDFIYDNFIFYNDKYACRIIAHVIMPEHLHFICYFENESRLSNYMRDFKKFTAFKIRDYYVQHDRAVLEKLECRERTQVFKIWMHRFDDLFLYSRKVILTKLNYIHNNPVKRGLSETPEAYEYSSARFYAGLETSKLNLLHVEELL